METISNVAQLKANIEVFENYLVDGNDDEQKQVRSLIRRGRCFVSYKVNDEIRFAPSRFLGYINNSLEKHNKFEEKHGTLTNAAIIKVLKQKLIPNSELENRYVQYCYSINLEPTNYTDRKYWSLNLDIDFDKNKEIAGEFPEGKIVERIHRSRERSSKVISAAKSNFKLKNGRVFCEVCGFDFEKEYGDIGIDFIEGHHTIPVSEMKENHKTSPVDIVLLCSNCHRMAHKKRPWLTLDKIKELIL